MATITLGGHNLCYPVASDLNVGSLLEPVIISQGTVGNFSVKLRLSVETSPCLFAECADHDSVQSWYAPFPEALLNGLVQDTRRRHTVGLLQPHLAETLARWVATSRFNPEYMESKLLDRIA